MSSNRDSEIMVSVNCVTYNHKDYIRQALDSFLMQKTSFEFEILVHDDASTDGTGDILREYEKKVPRKGAPSDSDREPVLTGNRQHQRSV